MLDPSFDAAERAFAAEADAFFARAVTPEVRAALVEGQDEFVSSFHHQLGVEGWIGLQWPPKLGGRGLGYVEAAIFQEQAALHGAPMLASNLSSIVGSTIIELGSESVRQRFLPPAAAGEIVFCLGYSEAEAGSDLGSLKTRAVQVGSDFVITGTKMFTSLAHVAHFMLCAARTDVEAPPHRGITVFLVDMSDVGVSPIWTLGGFRTNETFLDEVRVPAENIVGEVNAGWHVLMTALDFERAGTSRVGQAKRLLGLTAAAVDRSDTRAIDMLGRLYGEVLAVEALAYKVAWLQSQGMPTTKDASLVKIAGTELVQRIADQGTAALGPCGLLARGACGVLAGGELEEEYRNTVRYTVTAGTNEIQRNIVAQRGLGLPRGV